MATYNNDLRLKEIATGDESGTWGTSTNTNLSLIADGFSYGTKAFAADADETFTMPDFSADATRSLYLKFTGTLTATRTATLGPNTVSKVWIIENATTGSQSITIAQGSGGTVTIPSGQVKAVYTDGAGASAAVTDALVDLALNTPVLTSPTMTAPVLGTPASGTLTNATGLPISTGVSGLGSGMATFLATPSSANLRATLTDETGSGAAVFATSPTLVTPALGTPSSVTLTNATGLPISTGVSGLGTGVATFLATPSSANLAAAVTGETGSGALVFATSPTLTTPNLGTPSAATLTNATGLPLSSGVTGTLALSNGGTGASLSDPNADRILFWDDSAGAVTWLTASTGLSLSGTSLTNSDLGSSQSIFKNIAVSGQTTVVADSNDDTLTFVAGTGVTITTNATTDSVTISATGTGGTVTSVSGTGTKNGLTLSGTVTSSGNITLGGTLAINNSDWSGTDLSLANGGTGASLADPNADRIFFWDDSAGTTTWLTVGSGLQINGTSLENTQSGGSVTSVGTSGTVNGITLTGGTITTAGTITLGGTLAISNADWSGADLSLANGGTGASLADPNADRIMFWDDSAGAVTWLEVGSGLSLSGTTLTATGGGGSGTVTSVATSGSVNGLTLTGGPITTTGTVTLGGTLAISNSDWSGADLSLANGGTGTSLTAPTSDKIMFWDNSAGAMEFLTVGTTMAITGTTIDVSSVNLASQVTGTLPTTNGGTGITSLGAGVATWLGTPSSANLLAAVTDETGTGALVFATSPILTTPNLGTPSYATLTNATGLPISTGVSGLGTGVATFLATPSSANLAAAVTGETGSGALVFGTGPTLTSAVLSAVTLNDGVTEEYYALGSTEDNLDPANGSIQTKTLNQNKVLTATGFDSGQSMTLMLSGGTTYTVTWPTMTWVSSAGNTAPTLTANDTIVLWKIGSTLYGAYAGSYA